MTTRIRYRRGRGSVEIIGPQKKIIEALLNDAEPEIMRVLKNELLQREQFARPKWPTRQKKYGKSQRSKDRFTRIIRIVPPATIEAAIQNTAPYSWAIIAGRKSKTPVSAGKRVANELLWKPAKKSASRLVNDLANAAIKPVRRVR